MFDARRETESITIPKNKNFAEIIAISTTKPLAIQRRTAAHENDTVFLSISQMKQKEYLLELILGPKIISPHINAFLEDTYLHRFERLEPNDSTIYHFSITADSGSYATARFRIVFKQAKTSFSIRTLLQPQNQISVKWEMPEMPRLVEYQIEKSLDGIEFTTADSRQSTAKTPAQLEWVDAMPYLNDTYYRVKYFTKNGEVIYSNIAKATIKKGVGISVYPNPVTNNRIILQMNEQPDDEYDAEFINSSGQVIFTDKWNNAGTRNTKVFEIPSIAAKGIYRLEITQFASKRTTSISVNVQ